MNIPNKGDIIINPKSNRPIRVGSRTWLNLVKEGLLNGHYTDPKQLATIQEEDIENQIDEVNKTLPIGKQAVRGRGLHKGKIVSRNQQPKPEEISKYTAKIASKVVSEVLQDNECLENLHTDDLEAELEMMILQEMANNQNDISENVPKVKISSKCHKKTRGRPSEDKYLIQNSKLYDDDDDDYYDDDDLF
tara:strand:+ start:144 stop:716 length:573 start_codon:yes stop_codon:yes gene_type:complete